MANEQGVWRLVNGELQRWCKKITKTWRPKDSDEKLKRSIEDITILVPQSLDEVPDHSELSALQLCQWSIASKRYLMARELIPKGLKADEIELKINDSKVGSQREMKVESRIDRAIKKADLTDEQKLELERRTLATIDDILNS